MRRVVCICEEGGVTYVRRVVCICEEGGVHM